MACCESFRPCWWAGVRTEYGLLREFQTLLVGWSEDRVRPVARVSDPDGGLE